VRSTERSEPRKKPDGGAQDRVMGIAGTPKKKIKKDDFNIKIH
jgi:hypothetical protein